MNAVYGLSKDITTILIAHRLSTVKKCDTIFLIEEGKIKQKGSFDELIKISKSFKANASD